MPLWSSAGFGSLGKTGIAGRPLATNQQINSIVFDEQRVLPRYGLHAMRCLKCMLEAMAPATTVPIVSKSKFEALTIAVSLVISANSGGSRSILDQADDLRRKRRDALSKGTGLPSCVLIEACGNPATNPMNWPVGRLGEERVRILVGRSLRVSPEYVETGIPFLSTRTLSTGWHPLERNLFQGRVRDRTNRAFWVCATNALSSGLAMSNDSQRMPPRIMVCNHRIKSAAARFAHPYRGCKWVAGTLQLAGQPAWTRGSGSLSESIISASYLVSGAI